MEAKVASGDVSLYPNVSNDGVAWARPCAIEAGGTAKQKETSCVHTAMEDRPSMMALQSAVR